jgi:hypothetical protein
LVAASTAVAWVTAFDGVPVVDNRIPTFGHNALAYCRETLVFIHGSGHHSLSVIRAEHFIVLVDLFPQLAFSCHFQLREIFICLDEIVAAKLGWAGGGGGKRPVSCVPLSKPTRGKRLIKKGSDLRYL